MHMMEYYLAIKRNEIPTHATAWMNDENVMLSEMREKESEKEVGEGERENLK